MPFKSDQQRKFMYAQHPEIAKRWSAEEKKLPIDHLKKRKLPFRKTPPSDSSKSFSSIAHELLEKRANNVKNKS